jgi:hypothetical protein
MAWGSPICPSAFAAARRTSRSLSWSAWMRAGMAWGSPICPSAFAAASRTYPLLIPKRLDEGGDGLRVADLPQRPRRRPAHIHSHPEAPG